MKKPSFSFRMRLPVTLTVVLCLTVGVTLLALGFQPIDLCAVLTSFWNSPLLILLNLLPVGLLILAFSFLFQNVFFSAALVNLLTGVLSIANRIKIEVRDEPVFPRDLSLLKEVNSVSTYDIHYPWGSLSVLIGTCLLLTVLGILFRRHPFLPEKKGRGRGLVLRLGGGAASLGLLVGLVFTVYASDELYSAFPTSNPYYLPSVFNELGFPYCFTHHFTAYSVDKPEGYDRAEAEVWDSTAGESSSAVPVNVIMVMNEAFSDLTDYDAFTYSQEEDPLLNLHKLRQDPNCMFGHVAVPSFAGGTANTEFDVLTGMQTNALAAAATSAFRVVNRNLDSLFRVYAADGYHTSFLHPGNAWFYNRENVYQWLGAEEILFAKDMVGLERKGRWVTDDSLASVLLERYEAARDAGTPLFNYTTTIQNHMSYTINKYGEDYDYPPVQTSAVLSEEAETLLSVYIEGVRDADAMLGRLYQYFAAEDAPVVLVFFGDHLPYLGDNQLAYQELGMTESPVWDVLTAYETPYVIWANAAAADALDWDTAFRSCLGEQETISACYLGAAVLELTGRAGESPWFRYLTELCRELPVLQRENVRSDHTMTTTDNLTDEQTRQVSKLRCWSYYKLVDSPNKIKE